MLVRLALVVLDDDDDDTTYLEIPDGLLDRLMATDDTITLASIAREMRQHIRSADDAVAGLMADIADSLPGFGHGKP